MTRQRRLYYMMTDDTAIQYPVGVGRLGMAWSGTAHVDGKYVKPAWSPPDMIKRENPRVPGVIPSGSSANPMGAAAMPLSGGGQYAPFTAPTIPDRFAALCYMDVSECTTTTSWTCTTVSVSARNSS